MARRDRAWAADKPEIAEVWLFGSRAKGPRTRIATWISALCWCQGRLVTTGRSAIGCRSAPRGAMRCGQFSAAT